MNLVTAIIIDDEQGSIATLSELLKLCCPDINLVGTAQDLRQGLELIQRVQPQLIFLDISLGDVTGFDLLNSLQRRTAEIIFVTAYEHHALKAFNYAAVHYLLKPVSIDDLQSAVNRAVKKIQAGQVNVGMDKLLELAASLNNAEKIGLPTVNGLYFEKLSNIIYISAEGSYSVVHINSGKNEVVSKNLGELENMLPESVFARVHHSSLININHIKRYVKGRGGYLEMSDGAEIEVSSRKKDEFLARFK